MFISLCLFYLEILEMKMRRKGSIEMYDVVVIGAGVIGKRHCQRIV